MVRMARREKEIVQDALAGAEDALMALDFALDRLLAAVKEKDEMAVVLAAHAAGKGVYEAREAVEAILGILRELQRRYEVERLERGDKGP
jgi:hypothetical protein